MNGPAKEVMLAEHLVLRPSATAVALVDGNAVQLQHAGTACGYTADGQQQPLGALDVTTFCKKMLVVDAGARGCLVMRQHAVSACPQGSTGPQPGS